MSLFKTQTCKFTEKRLQDKCFPVNIANLLKASFIEHVGWLPLKVTAENFWRLHLEISFENQYWLQLKMDTPPPSLKKKLASIYQTYPI